MVRESNAILEAQNAVAVKLVEPEPESEEPWLDDMLNRQEIANRLTNLIATQVPPLTVSLHGQWGTGKTFLLKRWQKDLEIQGFKAIYFNAWEDDFCDDPLLAFLGQLANYFKEPGFTGLARHAANIAFPLFKQNVSGIVKTTTGLTIDLTQLQQNNKSLLDAYLGQRATKDQLRKKMETLAKRVVSETGHPLVFIVDELDRCRPTFAIELLERVKHIFDVPNIVFVFGLNRDELCKSLTSVYGDIEANVYLRRFFDFDFNLPKADSREFAQHLMTDFGLYRVAHMSANAGNPRLMWDYDNFLKVCPRLWSSLNLSLRDTDYGVRLLALLTRNAPIGAYTHPYLLALLIGFKFKNAEVYESLVSGRFRTSSFVKFLIEDTGATLTGRDFIEHLDRIEGFLYCADSGNRSQVDRGGTALSELRSLMVGGSDDSLVVISSRAQEADQETRERLCQAISDGQDLGISRETFGQLAKLIDTYQEDLRR